jgi:VanZ family protein
MARFCSALAVALLVFSALGPTKWQLRTRLGWQIEHFLGYFAVTSIVCLAWPRPLVVGGTLMAVAGLLEGLQRFTPDRSPDVQAALWGAGGALVAGLLAEAFLRLWGGATVGLYLKPHAPRFWGTFTSPDRRVP